MKDQQDEKPRKSGTDGCGRWIGNCGHIKGQPQKPTTGSGTCACGSAFEWNCPGGGSCNGKDFYC